VAGVGPQLNYFFPVTDKIQGVVNVKAYWEFAAQNRPDGWNAWLTIASSPAPSKKPEDELRKRFPRFGPSRQPAPEPGNVRSGSIGRFAKPPVYDRYLRN
jgi:hypothetical protein